MQEREGAYKVTDYLHQREHMSFPDAVDVSCRSQMIEWMKNIIDHCQFSRSTIAVAVNYMDRFLMVTPWARRDRSAFQLVAITCLYMAIKIYEPTVLSASSVVKLTRNAYGLDQIESMERLVLQTISWRMNPPTAVTFAMFLCEYATTLDASLHRETLQELVVLQLESTLSDYETSLIPASMVALAALNNAVFTLGLCSGEQRRTMEWEFKSFMNLAGDVDMYDVQVRLYEKVLVSKSPSCKTAAKLRVSHSTCTTTHSGYSPRAVSDLKVLS